MNLIPSMVGKEKEDPGYSLEVSHRARRSVTYPIWGYNHPPGDWLSDKAVNLMSHNKNIESLMKELHPDFGTPSFHKVGWKSRKINKSGRRFYQIERRE